ncbi:Phytanoyl-CoA dioxygenase family protein [Aspergillus sclerotialis]|uniref:Phytanoyl-CoA dioxygenase family protein n=1 Tax=Aspergillus sclerotialis TaxID=2070753 RepID=A0A3A2ZFG5_9EURO|nr:Phytanoyl-CoA dioxygenase family protein [Aspergillus sclerotialis]
MSTALKSEKEIHVEISDHEHTSGQMSRQNIEKAVVALAEHGIVILDNAVSEQSLDYLNERMTKDARYLRENGKTQFNYSKKAQNILQHMVPEPEYLLSDIQANPFAVAVCQAVLGPKPILRYHKANTNFPGESRQPVHSDVHYEHPRACFALAVNTVLIDCSPENGSTECWPGTHLTTRFADQNGMNGIFPHLLEERAKVVPPLQPSIKKGGLIIRDMRLWHAGMPNKTADEVRVMLNLIYFADWYRSPMKIKFPKQSESRIRQLEIESGTDIAAEYVDNLDYLTLGHTHDFGQDDKREEFGRNRE